MKLFIAGIGGTLMAGIAQIAKSLGHQVSGCDANVYPPMRDLLAAADIPVKPGYVASHITPAIDCVLIGNALSRGNPLVEHVLSNKLAYDSGPGWLNKNVLRSRNVIAIAGTHGKTSTAAMATWILHQNGKAPGYLIGGKPGNFEQSASLGGGEWFVIEADEYDTAFFDKRSKFVHYAPDIAVLNNLEFDHADIFDDIEQIIRQFHHLLRIVPGNGHIVCNRNDPNLARLLPMGVWSPQTTFSTQPCKQGWSAQPINADGSQFMVCRDGESIAAVNWHCIGAHNISNALAAIAATVIAGVAPRDACQALAEFVAGARRLQRLYADAAVTLYHDFAHHPTAIATTLAAVRAAHPEHKLIAIVEPKSNTMRRGHHGEQLKQALATADHTIFYAPTTLAWQPQSAPGQKPIKVFANAAELINATMHELQALHQLQQNAVIIAMSNGSFEQIPASLAQLLRQQ